MDAIDAVSEEFRRLSSTPGISQDEVEDTFETLIDINHHLIASAGVSHPHLERVRFVTAAHGLHSKLTGAGGGGIMLTLIRGDTPKDTIDRAKAELTAEGFVCCETSVGGQGFRLVEVSLSGQFSGTHFGQSKPREEGDGHTWIDEFARCDFASLDATFSRAAKMHCT